MKTATLIEPYKGYRKIELIQKECLKWTVKIIDTGLIIEVYEDEFIIVVARFSRPGQETPAPTRDIKRRNKNEL